MGYHTDFIGEFKLNRHLTEEQTNYIKSFSETRRMKRDVNKLLELYKGKYGFPGTRPERNTPQEIYGHEGEYFVKPDSIDYGQGNDGTVLDHNLSPGQAGFLDDVDIMQGQPGLWCQWTIEDNGGVNPQVLVWDGGEKFYNYTEWLEYLITHFFTKWNVLLNGEVEWVGESDGDLGKIVVKNNKIKILQGRKVYE